MVDFWWNLATKRSEAGYGKWDFPQIFGTGYRKVVQSCVSGMPIPKGSWIRNIFSTINL